MGSLTRQQLKALCLSLPQSREDHPFGDETTAFRHEANSKIFALLMEREGRMFLNLKCDPLRAQLLRQSYRAVRPGWHMNKEHWNSVYPDEDLDRDMLYELIVHSFDLVKPKVRRRGMLG